MKIKTIPQSELYEDCRNMGQIDSLNTQYTWPLILMA